MDEQRKQEIQLEDLLTEISIQAVLDLDRIFLLDRRKLDGVPPKNANEWRARVLEDWWGARQYVLSPNFEADCVRAGIDPEAAVSRLTPKIVEGRKVYGRWVRKVSEINLPVEEEEES